MFSKDVGVWMCTQACARHVYVMNVWHSEDSWLDGSQFQPFTCFQAQFLVVSAAVLAQELLHGSPVSSSHLKIGMWDYRCGPLHLAFTWVLGIELGSACLLG